MITLTREEAALALGWSLDRDWPMLGPDEQALQDRLRAAVDPNQPCTKDWCCTACEGSGWAGQAPCSDCYGTGHPHPIPDPKESL